MARSKLTTKPVCKTAVGYLAWGGSDEWVNDCARFLNSYNQFEAGEEHVLYIIFNGFSYKDLIKAEEIFSQIEFKAIYLEKNEIDIGAYIIWSNSIQEEIICVLNSYSELLATNWLAKMQRNLNLQDVGLVGATGSYERLGLFADVAEFPNVHIRTNGFMIRREKFVEISNNLSVLNKKAAYNFESGPDSLTRCVIAGGEEVLIIGRDGRGYPPKYWPCSNTFRQGTQGNLLIADNQTRIFTKTQYSEKQSIQFISWGHMISWQQ